MPIIISIIILGVIAFALIIKGNQGEYLSALFGVLLPLVLSLTAGGAAAGFASIPLSPFIGVPIGFFVFIYLFKKMRR